jgi:putative SOS response-associated peptidase YedK
MCGRYTLAVDAAAVEELLHEADVRLDLRAALGGGLEPRYNIAPSQPVLALIADEPIRAVWLRWGLVPAWARARQRSAPPINARAETIAERPMFASAFARRRCVVLADGFYEWLTIGGVKRPCYLRRPDGRPFAMAGIWEPPCGPGEVAGDGLAGRVLAGTCALVTVAASAAVAEVHHRMPAVLEPAVLSRWLEAHTPRERLGAMLCAVGDDFFCWYEVSNKVNRAGSEGPQLRQALAGGLGRAKAAEVASTHSAGCDLPTLDPAHPGLSRSEPLGDGAQQLDLWPSMIRPDVYN